MLSKITAMKPVLTLLCLLVSGIAFSQIKLPGRAGQSVKKEVMAAAGDFYNRFSNIKGELEYATDSREVYKSKVVPKDALHCTITFLPALRTQTWEAKMLQTEEFESAAKSYSGIYRQLRNSNIVLNGRGYVFKGEEITPNERRSFSSSILALETDEEELKNLKIEVAMSYTFPEWELFVWVYEKQSDAEMGPAGRKVK